LEAGLEKRGREFGEMTARFMKDLLGQVVIARDDFLAEHADAAAGFARGLAKATLFGFSNPEGAVRLHWKMYPQSRPAGADDAKVLKDAIHVFNGRFESQRVDNREDKRWGASTPAQWQKLFTIARQEKLIQGTVDVRDVYTSSLIDEVNRFDAAAVIRQAREYR